MIPGLSPVGWYFHLPFCLSRCGYCDFAVVTDRDDSQSGYVESLEREIAYWSQRSKHPPVSLYFGGGTPSRLAPDLWKRLFSTLHTSFRLPEDCEITAEANPDSLDAEMLSLWKGLGINRLSVGVQSFDPENLRMLDRCHDRDRAIEVLASLPKAGYDNWSLDLIYGLPGQTLEDWLLDLETALGFDPPHLSFYNLILHPGLPVTLKANAARGPEAENLEADMFLEAISLLERHGYEVYELSNAARPGRRCVHNSLYWRGGEWIGFGMSAASCWSGTEFANPATWQAYLDLWKSEPDRLPRQKSSDPTTRLLDTLMLRWRTREGISPREIGALLGGKPLPESFQSLIDQLVQTGLALREEERIALSPRGWLVHSEITERAARCLERALG
jgi:oxygen-independent coproporphyrinogen-3 oxidase